MRTRLRACLTAPPLPQALAPSIIGTMDLPLSAGSLSGRTPLAGRRSSLSGSAPLASRSCSLGGTPLAGGAGLEATGGGTPGVGDGLGLGLDQLVVFNLFLSLSLRVAVCRKEYVSICQQCIRQVLCRTYRSTDRP